MAKLEQIVREHTNLDQNELHWLHLLLADWQIIADLSFADLVLWLPDRDGSGYWAGAQMRPTTGPTAYVDDVVGSFIPVGKKPLLDRAMVDGRVARDGDPEWRDSVPVRVEAVPVKYSDRVIALVARNTNLHGVRTPSRLELAYMQTAAELAQMIASGHFPTPGQRSDHADSPRVGDGFIRVNAHGEVTYASPNALSVYRRLGLTTDLTGQNLANVTRALIPPQLRPDELSISAVLGGRLPRDTEVASADATVIMRSIPMRPAGEITGALVLLRDVTELRRRDRELITKDATIREIHHRVKNNLQTVAALLRMQARRLEPSAGREALVEAERRVGSIAIVHELLSQSHEETVNFDEVADRLRAMVVDLGSQPGRITSAREGSIGLVDAAVATPLAIMVSELFNNAVEHGFGTGGSGHLGLQVEHHADHLVLEITDDGVGLPPDFDIEDVSSLGLAIVRTLVGELGGSLDLGPAPDQGTCARLVIPLR
ncbi:MAG TPA: histidine kinase N-terminal domain-containing protein [Marmoricola sp.]|nr:histidine kinase N-terminal domain-containing protein [Marmoricola sp.]